MASVLDEERRNRAHEPLSDDDIVRLAQYHHSRAALSLPPYILSPDSHPALISYLRSRCSNPSASSSVSEYAIALLSLISLSPSNPSLSALLAYLLLSYTKLFTSRKIQHDSFSLKTIQLFGSLLNYIPVKDLESIVDSIVSDLGTIECIDDAQLFELLPRCFELLRSPGESGSGNPDYVNSVFDNLVVVEWPKAMLIKMVSLAKEFGFLDVERKSEMLGKMFSRMKAVDMQDLPSVVYQLLVLASRGFCKREVIEGIVNFFGSKQETEATSIFRQIEGTVLLHVNFAVKQDPTLGQEFIRLVKLNFRTINHFTIAVLLSIARVRKFGESSLRALKTALLAAYGDYEFSIGCKWLPDHLKEDYVSRVILAEKSLLRAVNESCCGMEHILTSIVHIGFMLIESGKDGRRKDPYNVDTLLGVEELSIKMLKIVFEIHDFTRNEIIEQCKFRILSLKREQGLLIIRLLESLVQSYPLSVSEHISHLKELLDYFTFMDGMVASSLITALLPLIKSRRDLKDYIILVVRKAMFSREDVVCTAAANAIVDLMLADNQSLRDETFILQESSSQASCSQQAEKGFIKRGNLFHELNGLLQRCLYMQAKVREVIYYGLVKLAVKDTSIGGIVLDFLLPHFLQFYKENQETQFDISSCIRIEGNKVFIEEPFDALLSCLSWIFRLQPKGRTDRPDNSSLPCFGFALSQENEEGRNASHGLLSAAYKNIRNNFQSKKLEDFLEKAQGTMSTNIEEEKKKCCASLLLGVVEVLMNSVATELERASDTERNVLVNELLGFVFLLDSLDKDAIRPRHGGRKMHICSGFREATGNVDSGNAKMTEKGEYLPFFTTTSLCHLLQIMLELHNQECFSGRASSQSHNQSSVAKTVKRSGKILSFVLDASLCHINNGLGKEDHLKRINHGDMKCLGPPLLKLVHQLKPSQRIANDQKRKESKGKSDAGEKWQYLEIALLCLKDLISISVRNFTLTDLIDELLLLPLDEENPKNDATEEDSKVSDPAIRSLEIFIVKILEPLFLELLGPPVCREIEVLCDILLILGNNLPRETKNCRGSWAAGICKSNEIKNSNAVKSVIKLVLSLSSSPSDLGFAEEMAKDILKINSYGGSRYLNEPKSFCIINKATGVAVTSSILQYIESVVADMDWSIKKLRSFSLASRMASFCDDSGHIPGIVFERALYNRAEAAVRVLSSFVLMTLRDAQAEQLLRLASRFYKHLAQMTKLRIAPKGCKQLIPTREFERLVELTCKQLTIPLYNFVAEMQTDRREKPTKATVNKIKRENKCIPDLIFQVEDCEKYLIKLSKLSKVNLLKHAKRSTSRDFKILEMADPVGQGDSGQNGGSPHEDDSADEGKTDESAENGSANMPSPDCRTGLGVEEIECGDEECGAPRPKRVRTSRVSDSELEGDEEN